MFIGKLVKIQEKLIEKPDCKPDDDFLESFASVVGGHWSSLATLLSISSSDIKEINTKREEGGHEMQALQVLRKWQQSSPEATYGQLYQKLQTISIFQC